MDTRLPECPCRIKHRQCTCPRHTRELRIAVFERAVRYFDALERTRTKKDTPR